MKNKTMDKFKSFYQCVQLLRCLFDPLRVVAVDHKYQTLKTNRQYLKAPHCSCFIKHKHRLLG